MPPTDITEENGAGSPAVSVVIPAYHSERTLGACLAALSEQSFRSFEVVLVDSSRGDSCREVAGAFPAVRYRQASRRLLPQEARNVGAAAARGELVVFTDPDVYAEPDWLERLVAAHRRTGHVVVGALACHGRLWLDRGIHLCKFSKWLPGGPPGPVDMSPTANMLIPRSLFTAVGGFPGDLFQGDTNLSWELTRRGHVLWLESTAVVRHHHLSDLRGFLRERYERGREFAALRMGWRRGGRRDHLAFLLASALPIRLLRNLALAAGHARRAGYARDYLATLPVVTAGFAASLAGESVTYARGALRSGAALRRRAVEPTARIG